MCAAGTAFRTPLSKWKAKYGGLDVSAARRLKVLEDENAKLKKLQAEERPPVGATLSACIGCCLQSWPPAGCGPTVAVA
jgi:hypothetical protein